MIAKPRTPPRSGLTPGQRRLLGRHRDGLERLSQTLAQKMDVCREELLLIVAHPGSCLGDAIRRFTRDRAVSKHAVVLPELARDLDTWIERLALTGPVVDCTDGESGVPVLLIDELGEMALTRLSG